MYFSFSEVENALALTHDIADDRRQAFKARLQHLQKLKFPAGLNTGRGRAARYRVGHVYLLGVALELLQLGLSPERAKRVIEEDLHSVAMAASLTGKNLDPTKRCFDSPVLLYCDPAALRELMQTYQGEDWASQTFFYAGMGQALEQFRTWFSEGVERMAFFSVSALVYDLAYHTVAATEDMNVFKAELDAWSDPIIHNVDYDTADSDQPYWNTLEGDDGDT